MSPRGVWAAYAACLVIVAAALTALTHRALEADRAEAAARREAAVEENVRLALWRLDSALATLVARETANIRSARLVPPVVETFVIDATGRRRTLATAADRDSVRFDAATLVARLPEPPTGDAPAAGVDATLLTDLPVQQARNASELQARRQALQQNYAAQQQIVEPAGITAAPLAPLSAVWADGGLVLARRMPPGGDDDAVEGCVLDWPRLRADLLATVFDLLPEATLEPVKDAAPAIDQRLLAAIPARLVPGEMPRLAPAGWSPLRGTLAAAWGAMAVAAAAVGALLASVLALSERRAAFVSSVTHELRTPLTTFRLYAGLLEEGMVPPAEVPGYHATLRREADRLTHLVENVLAYARLERGRHAARLVPVRPTKPHGASRRRRRRQANSPSRARRPAGSRRGSRRGWASSGSSRGAARREPSPQGGRRRPCRRWSTWNRCSSPRAKSPAARSRAEPVASACPPPRPASRRRGNPVSPRSRPPRRPSTGRSPRRRRCSKSSRRWPTSWRR